MLGSFIHMILCFLLQIIVSHDIYPWMCFSVLIIQGLVCSPDQLHAQVVETPKFHKPAITHFIGIYGGADPRLSSEILICLGTNR
jgi:hypothetical protein